MKEMTILQKEDLPYFEELEKEGRAVILRFDSLDQFMKFDLESILKNGAAEPDLSEIQAWVSEQKNKVREAGAQTEQKLQQVSQINEQIELLQKLLVCDLPDADKELISQAISSQLPYQMIMELLDPKMSSEQRSSLIQEKTKENNTAVL